MPSSVSCHDTWPFVGLPRNIGFGPNLSCFSSRKRQRSTLANPNGDNLINSSREKKNQIKGAWSVPSWLPARAQVGAAMASCWHETEGMAGQPCPPTKLKYLAVTVMTAASTVLAKSVRFIKHVSPGCCAGILVRVNLSISSFSCLR